MYVHLHVKYPFFLSYFHEIWIFSADIWKTLKYQFSWKELFRVDEWAESWRVRYNEDMAKLIVAVCNFFNVFKNIPCILWMSNKMQQ